MSSQPIRKVREGLAELIDLVNSERVTTSAARVMLAESKAIASQVAVWQADAAARVAAGERHGDGGAGVLAETAGVTRQEAATQVKTGAELQAMPQVRDAVTEGKIGLANAKSLVKASGKTDASQVAADGDLLAKAASMPPEQFSRVTNRWIATKQADGGESDYRAQRRRRELSIKRSDEDGMFHLWGRFDNVTGTKLKDRLESTAELLRRDDVRTNAAEQRSFPQRMADAFDVLTETSGSRSCGSQSCGKTSTGRHAAVSEITIVQHLDADGDKAFAEIADGSTIPPSVLEEHFCNARVVGVVFNSKGHPLWRGTTIARPTKAQIDALNARYGGRCGGCGGQTGLQSHHIVPLSEGGPTNIDNLIPVCWACHNRIHHHDWQVEHQPGHDLPIVKPPERIRHGPAHAPDPPPGHDPPSVHDRPRGGQGPGKAKVGAPAREPAATLW